VALVLRPCRVDRFDDGIQPLELDARCRRGEVPAHFALRGVARRLPGRDLRGEPVGLGMRRRRHWRQRTLGSGSAMLSPLPCFGCSSGTRAWPAGAAGAPGRAHSAAASELGLVSRPGTQGSLAAGGRPPRVEELMPGRVTATRRGTSICRQRGFARKSQNLPRPGADRSTARGPT